MGPSSAVTKMHFSPRAKPAARNCRAKMVFPVPGSPVTRIDRPLGKPPSINGSKPMIPLVTRSVCIIVVLRFAALVAVLFYQRFRCQPDSTLHKALRAPAPFPSEAALPTPSKRRRQAGIVTGATRYYHVVKSVQLFPLGPRQARIAHDECRRWPVRRTVLSRPTAGAKLRAAGDVLVRVRR